MHRSKGSAMRILFPDGTANSPSMDEDSDGMSTDESLYTSAGLSRVPSIRLSRVPSRVVGYDDAASVMTNGTDHFITQLNESKKIKRQGSWASNDDGEEDSETSEDDYGYDGKDYDMELASAAVYSTVTTPSIKTPSTTPTSPRHASPSKKKGSQQKFRQDKRRDCVKLILMGVVALALAVAVGLLLMLLIGDNDTKEQTAPQTPRAPAVSGVSENIPPSLALQVRVTTAPTKAPTKAPQTETPISTITTAIPSLMTSEPAPSAAPTAARPCVDSPEPFLSVEGTARGCDWLQERPAALVLFCAEEEVKNENCPATCGACTR